MRRPLAILLALPPLFYSGGAVFFGFLAAEMQCDEICDDNSADWRFTRGAWQWHLLGGLGLVAFLAGIGFFISISTRRPLLALVCLLLGSAAIVAAVWGIPVNPGSDQELDVGRTFILGSAAVLVSGMLAVGLAARPVRK
jgi:hypothetical protein